MHFLRGISLALSSVTFAHAAVLQQRSSTTNDSSCLFTNETRYGIAEIMPRWSSIWRGNFSDEVLSTTVMPDIQIYQDRLPTSTNTSAPVSVTNQTELVAFVGESHKGFSSYSFINNFYFVNPEGDKLVTRWTLQAIVGNDTTSPIRKPGDLVTMNGTDLVLFDDCSGRIRQVLTAQDLLSFTYQVGMNIIHVP